MNDLIILIRDTILQAVPSILMFAGLIYVVWPQLTFWQALAAGTLWLTLVQAIRSK